MFIKTVEGWKLIPVYAEPASDDPRYKGEHGKTFALQDPWADRLNREARARNE